MPSDHMCSKTHGSFIYTAIYNKEIYNRDDVDLGTDVKISDKYKT